MAHCRRNENVEWQNMREAACVQGLGKKYISFHPGISLLEKSSETPWKPETTRYPRIGYSLNALWYGHRTKCYVASTKRTFEEWERVMSSKEAECKSIVQKFLILNCIYSDDIKSSMCAYMCARGLCTRTHTREHWKERHPAYLPWLALQCGDGGM